MATKQIGKLKYNISKRGIAFKWGDGAIHRFAFQRPQREPEDAYDNEQGYDEGYNDGYDRGESYRDSYSDGYHDADAYDQGGDQQEYYEDEEPRPKTLLDYLCAYDWIMWLALVILPPLGIYLLWKKRPFEKMVCYGISAASAIWFVLMLVLLFSNVLRGPSDQKTNQSNNITVSTASPIPTIKATTEPTTEPTATPAPTPQVGGTGVGDMTVTNTGNANAGDNGNLGGTTEDPIVYYTALGEYYHSTPNCTALNGAQATAGVLSMAVGQGKTACPTCMGMNGNASGTGTATGTVYYATSTGKNFHLDKNCTGMKDAQPISRADAEARNQSACPKCVGYYYNKGGNFYHTLYNCLGNTYSEIGSLEQVKYLGKAECPVCIGGTPDTTMYYHTAKGKEYHTDPNCKGMQNAVRVSLKAALAAGQTPCATCVTGNGSANSVVYATDGGKWYHKASTCPAKGMKNGKAMSVAAAVAKNKTPCPSCMGGTTTTGSSSNSTIVYATDGGKWYHKASTCPAQGMKGGKAMTIADAVAKNKTPCPSCMGTATTGSGNVVYYRTDGKWYHIKADCQGMKDPISGTVAQAKAAGNTPCPECIGSTSAMVWGRKDGKYYHVVSNCTGMSGASHITVKTAEKAGLDPCPTCIGGDTSAGSTSSGYTSYGEKIEVYCTEGGRHYHANPTCTGMQNAKGTTIERAKKAGKTACPTCMGGTSTETVYATKYGTYYHKKQTCLGMSGATEYTVASATSAGKYACPVCIGASDTRVYITKNGSSYHVLSNCGGMTSPTLVKLKDAIAMGKDLCPNCIGTSSALYKNYGASVGGPESVGSTGSANGSTSTIEDSGFIVYCAPGGSEYHSIRTCSGMTNAKAVPLTEAIKAGRTACKTCIQATSENAVYCRSDSRYYHTNPTCSGMTNASRVTIAIATANGKTPCPTCAGGEMVGGNSGNNTGSGITATEGEKVYCNATNKYYHKAANIHGMVNGQATTKERAVSVHGKSPCPVCYDLKTSGSTSVLTSVYWNPNGENFHLEDDCRGMKGAIEGTVEQAKAAGKTACPVCFSTDKQTRVYTTASDKYYHSKSVCNGEKKTIATTYTKAVMAGKKGCPICTGKNNSSSRVYAGTKFYHYDPSNCTNPDSNDTTPMSKAAAVEEGLQPCPDCVP